MPKKPVASSSSLVGAGSRSPSPNKTKKGRGIKKNKEDDVECGLKPGNTTLVEDTLVQDTEIWTQALENLDEITRRGRTAEDEDIRRAAEITEYRLGHALLRFAGPGEIHGVVNTEQDPDERHNPRELDLDHVRILSEVFSRGNIKDRETPIRIVAPPDSVEEDLLTEMKVANPSDPASVIPTLELKRPNAKRERELESQLLYHFDGQKLLSDNEVEALRKELRELRAQRPLARIVNGNHRINAMINAAKMLHEEAASIIWAERNGEGREINQKWLNLNERISKATYTVEVYRDDTPDHVLAWLAENEEDRPNYAPRAGEKLWSIVDSQEALVRHMLQTNKRGSRREALDWIMDVVERRIPADNLDDATILAGMRGLNLNSSPLKKGKSEEISDEAISQLITHPATNAMVVDTSRALWVYNERMLESHIQIMRKDLGAPLIAHYWMGIRLLLKIANVARGDGLEATEEFLAGVTVKSIPPKGLSAASKHWANLHKNPQRTPALLNQYGSEQVALFDDLMRKEMKRANVDIFAKNYADVRYISALRRVFWALGESFSKRSEPCSKPSLEHSRRFAASLQLYALLPLWEEGCDDERFFPAALLPNRQYVADYAKRLKSGSDTPGLWVLECLLDKYQLPWTAGSIRTSASQNTKNWHGRARGTHQILLRLIGSKNSVGRDAQLQMVMDIFDSPAFFSSLSAVDRFLTTGDEPRTVRLIRDCSARKSAVGSFPILETIVNRGQHPTFRNDMPMVQSRLKAARVLLKEAIFKENEGLLAELLAKEEVLLLISIEWWSSFDVRGWVRGWNDPPAKQMNTTSFLIAWGFITQEMVEHILPETLQQLPASRHLLDVARIVARAEGCQPWWAEEEVYTSLPCHDEGESEKDELEAEEEEPEETQAQVQTQEAIKSPIPARIRLLVRDPVGDQDSNMPSEQPAEESLNNQKKDRGLRELTARAMHVTEANATVARSASSTTSGSPPGNTAQHAEVNSMELAPSKESTAPALGASPCLSTPGSDGNTSPHDSTPLRMSSGPTAPVLAPRDHVACGEANPGRRDKQQAGALVETAAEVEESAPQLDESSLPHQVREQLVTHRISLLKSVCSMVRQCERPEKDFPYALEYCVSGLVPDIVFFRTIFISRVSQTLQEAYGCSAEEGQAKADLIAKSDGLFEYNLVNIDPFAGRIKLRFRGALYQAAQQAGNEGHAYITEARMVPRDPAEVNRAIAARKSYTPPTPYGDTLGILTGQYTPSSVEDETSLPLDTGSSAGAPERPSSDTQDSPQAKDQSKKRKRTLRSGGLTNVEFPDGDSSAAGTSAKRSRRRSSRRQTPCVDKAPGKR